MEVTSSIYLCRVPTKTTNQFSFKNLQEQYNYFSSKVLKSYPNCRFTPRSGSIKVRGYVDDLNMCNYGFYINSYNGTTKTYYFWIAQKRSLSAETTELIIQIDVFQTWLFEMKFGQCFIERETVDDDSFGNHTISEDFQLGDYVTYKKNTVDFLTGEPCFFMGITDSDEIGGGVFGQSYSALSYLYFDYKDTNLIDKKIQELCNKGKADSIAYLFPFPKKMIPKNLTLESGKGGFSGFEGILQKDYNINGVLNKFSFKGQGYKPRNNKCLCYPFNFITVKNDSGSNVIVKYENFTITDTITFKIETTLSPNPIVTCTPFNYLNKGFAIDDSISVQPYGLCSWNNDNFANWYAQHQHSINAQSNNATMSFNASKQVIGNNYNNGLENNKTNAIKGAFNTGLGVIGNLGFGNIGGAIATALSGGVNTYLDYNQANRNLNNDLQNSNLLNNTNYQNAISSIVASVEDAKVQPNTAKGSTGSCGLDLARNTGTFFIEQTAIKPEYMKMIDGYFNMFGYKVNRFGKPNLNSRKCWNYIKCTNSNVYGDIPYDDLEEINNIFNNGLTIWHDKDNIYVYDRDNPINS